LIYPKNNFISDLAKLNTTINPLVTVAIPSLNHARFLDRTIKSIYDQELPVEVFVIDGGSIDGTLDVIEKWSSYLAGWRSRSDDGQSAAINEGISRGSAPFVTWINSDDYYLKGGLKSLLSCIEDHPLSPMVYAKSFNENQNSGTRATTRVEKFSVNRLAEKCIISQPATLIRRSAWEALDGLNQNLLMAMDYDLWWRIYKAFGAPYFLDEIVAINSIHPETKTNKNRKLHFSEAMAVVKRHYGVIPARWWLAYPYSVGIKTLINRFFAR